MIFSYVAVIRDSLCGLFSVVYYIHLPLNLETDTLVILFSCSFPFRGKGASAFSPSHPLLPLRQRQQKTAQGEGLPGKSARPLHLPWSSVLPPAAYALGDGPRWDTPTLIWSL